MISFLRTFISFKYHAERETRKRDVISRNAFSASRFVAFSQWYVSKIAPSEIMTPTTTRRRLAYRRHDFLTRHRHQHVHLRSFITHSFSPSPSLSLPFRAAKRREIRRIINFRQRHCFLWVTSGRPCSFQRHRGVFHVHSYGMYASTRDLTFEFSVIACTCIRTYVYVCEKVAVTRWNAIRSVAS